MGKNYPKPAQSTNLVRQWQVIFEQIQLEMQVTRDLTIEIANFACLQVNSRQNTLFHESISTTGRSEDPSNLRANRDPDVWSPPPPKEKPIKRSSKSDTKSYTQKNPPQYSGQGNLLHEDLPIWAKTKSTTAVKKVCWHFPIYILLR
jgi:hypothetical protein